MVSQRLKPTTAVAFRCFAFWKCTTLAMVFGNGTFPRQPFAQVFRGHCETSELGLVRAFLSLRVGAFCVGEASGNGFHD